MRPDEARPTISYALNVVVSVQTKYKRFEQTPSKLLDENYTIHAFT